jgi:hypothetical protein
LALATVRTISSEPVDVGTVAVWDGAKLIGVAAIAGCNVVHSGNSLTISIASANVKGISGCSFFCMPEERIIGSAIPEGSLAQYWLHRISLRVIVVSFCKMQKSSEN